MKKQHRIFPKFLLFVLVFCTSLLNAQQYPVQVTPVLLPPYSLRLGDYATTSDNKLQLQLLMKDLMEPSHRIKIRFSLESGVNSTTVVQNAPFINGMQEITLYPGTPLLLTNVDLRPLFQLENLTGINAVNYARPLPEGMYKFCFQVFDAGTGRALSAKSAAIAYFVQYEPPILNLPQRGEKILKPGEFQNIVFQWMPRQMAPNTRYIFTLKELWDNERDPVSGFLSSRALWQEETYAPTLFYGMDKTALIPGKRYAWQVQAKSGNPVVGNTPTEDNGVYKNNGLSEIFYFDYTENCIIPIMLTAKNVGRGKTEIRWTMTGNSSGSLYRIQYRRKGSATEWAQQESYQDMCILTGLKDEAEYEYRVGSVCGNLYQTGNTGENAYAFSGIQNFVTDSKKTANKNIQCGILPQIDIVNKLPLQTALGTNEVFIAGDFPVTVLQSQGTNGTYTGYGYIEVPYLADTKIKVTFSNIQLNTDKQLIGGIVETTYDVNESSLSYVSQGIGETFGDRGVESVIVDYVISNIEYVATPPPGKIVITGNSGKGNNDDGGSGESSRQDLPAGKDYAITDKDGNVWHVDEDGNVTKGEKVAEGGASTSKNTEGITGSGSSARVSQYTAKGVKVEWYETEKTKYAYDTAEKVSSLKDKYPTIKDADGNTVYISYKAVVNKSEDVLGARITFTDEALKDRKIIFKTLKIGQEIAAQKASDNNYTLTLKGTMNYAEEDVIAVLMPNDSTQKQKLIGSFKLVHLEPKEINVALVPTDEISKGKLGDIIKETDAIYSRVGVTINFKEDDIFDITPYLENNKSIPTESNSLTSTYSSTQQAINNAYGDSNGDRYILFITNKESSTGQMGYMRLGGRFGYIFKSPTGKTVAHEIGHGVFQLEHPWEKYKIAQSSTDLLMDYSGGTNLCHLDWKQINDPALKFHFFQGQGKGEFRNYIVTPDYRIAKLPNPNTLVYEACNFDNTRKGVLYGFIEDEKTYCWENDKYYLSGTNSEYPGTIKYIQNPESKDIISLFFDIERPCPSKELTVEYSEISEILNTEGLNKFIGENVEKAINVPCGEWDYSSEFFEFERFELLKSVPVQVTKIQELGTNEIKSAIDQINELILKNNSGYAYSTDMGRADLGQISIDKNISFENSELYKIDHRLVYLSEYSASKNNPVNIYVVYTKVNLTMSANVWNHFAKKVYEESNLKDRNAVLITIPYFTQDSEDAVNKYNVTYFMPGVYAKGVDVKTSDIKKINAGTYYKSNNSHMLPYKTITYEQSIYFIKQIYQYTYKPYLIYWGLRYPDGTIDPIKEKGEEYKPGYEFTKTVILQSNKYYDEIQKLYKPNKQITTVIPTYGITTGYENPNYEVELLTYEIEKAELVEAAANSKNSDDWLYYPNSIDFKEKLLDDSTANKYIIGYAFKNGFKQWCEDLSVVYGGTVDSPPIYQFVQTYNKDGWSTVDPVVHGTLSIASIGASFVAADAIPEAIGLMYSLARKDALSSAIYGTAIVMPVLASGELRAGQAMANQLVKGSKIYFKGAMYSLTTEGKLVKFSTGYRRGRVLDFFGFTDDAAKKIASSELDDFVRLFKNEKRISQSQIKGILGEVDEVKKIVRFKKVLKGEAGNKKDLFKTFDTNNNNVPSRYLQNEDRFNHLAADPDHNFTTSGTSRKEAMAGLEAEQEGILRNIERGPKGIEFYDEMRTPWDVKTPIGGEHFKVAGRRSIGRAIVEELTETKTIDGVIHPAGKYIDPISGIAKDKYILLDCTYINNEELSLLRNWLKNNSGLTPDQLDKIKEIVVPL